MFNKSPYIHYLLVLQMKSHCYILLPIVTDPDELLQDIFAAS